VAARHESDPAGCPVRPPGVQGTALAAVGVERPVRANHQFRPGAERALRVERGVPDQGSVEPLDGRPRQHPERALPCRKRHGQRLERAPDKHCARAIHNGQRIIRRGDGQPVATDGPADSPLTQRLALPEGHAVRREGSQPPCIRHEDNRPTQQDRRRERLRRRPQRAQPAPGQHNHLIG